MKLKDSVRIYELMTNNHMHNQYMYGLLKYYSNRKIEYLLLHGVRLDHYAERIALDPVDIPLKYFSNRATLFFILLRDFFSKKYDIKLSGCSTYYILFFALFSSFDRIEVHLHGQFFGASNNPFKRALWKFISKNVNLVLACPFYRDNIPVKIVPHIHFLSDRAKKLVTSHERENRKVVGIIVGKGREKWKGNNRICELENYGYSVKFFVKARSPDEEWGSNYINFFQSIDYLFLNPVNDYHLYSPSGLITDSYNYSKPMIAFSDNIFVTRLINRGCKNVILI